MGSLLPIGGVAMTKVRPRLSQVASLTFALAVLAGCSSSPEPLRGEGLTILQAATLIDGTNAKPRPNSVVALQGDRIVRVGEVGQFAYSDDATVIDLQGKWVIPGFIDTHVHMPEPQDQAIVLRTLLSFGITSIRSAAGDRPTGVELRDRLSRGEILGPRLRAAGRLIDAPGGIFSDWAAEVTTEEEIRAEVRRQAREGVDFIKLYRGIPPELVAVAIDEAHGLGLRVIGHLGATTWGQAASFGIDGLAHFGIFGTPWEIAPEEHRDRIRQACERCQEGEGLRLLREGAGAGTPESSTWARQLSERDVTIEPNLVLLRAVLWGDDPQELAALEPSLAPTGWRDGWWDALPHPYRAPCTDEWATEAQKTYGFFEGLVALLQRNGVTLTIGTDLMNPWMTPGVSYHRELELIVAAGLTSAEALSAATRGGALALGDEKEVGTIEEGKLADLIVLSADPLSDIRNTRSIESVILHGTLLNPETLLLGR
jgi:imidazolonepropionase-like amidohydrolase